MTRTSVKNMAMNSGIDRQDGEKQKEHDNGLAMRNDPQRSEGKQKERSHSRKLRTNTWDHANEGKYPIATLNNTIQRHKGKTKTKID